MPSNIECLRANECNRPTVRTKPRFAGTNPDRRYLANIFNKAKTRHDSYTITLHLMSLIQVTQILPLAKLITLALSAAGTKTGKATNR